MPADRRLERLAGREHAARERPGAGERLERPLPEQRLQHAVAHLQHGREGDLRRSGRLVPRFTTHSQKLAKGSDDDRANDHGQRSSRGSWRWSRSSPRAAAAADDAAGDHRRRPPRAAIKVGLITDLGQLNDNGFNELAYNGLKRAERELGVEGRVVESKSAADYVPNMTTLARQGYDLIIGVGFAQGDAIATAAKKYPGHEVRDRRRRPGDAQGQARERPGAPVPRGAGRLPRRLPRRARGEARRRQRRSAPSAASRSRPSTASSRATRRARRRPCRGSPSSGATRRTGTTRRSARSSR